MGEERGVEAFVGFGGLDGGGAGLVVVVVIVVAFRGCVGVCWDTMGGVGTSAALVCISSF